MAKDKSIIDKNVKFHGWYDAPFPFGRTEFTVTIEEYDEVSEVFTGRGEDKQGQFTISGSISGHTVIFVKVFSAAKAALDMQMSVSHSVSLSIRLSVCQSRLSFCPIYKYIL